MPGPINSRTYAGAILTTAAMLAAAPGAQAQTVINNQTVVVPPYNIPNAALIIGSTGAGTVDVTAAGSETVSLTTLGQQAGSTGTLNVEGSFSAEGITVGDSGTGILSISNGGSVSTPYSIYFGFGAGSSGSASVTTLGTLDSTTLQVGVSGTGTLTIASGGVVTTSAQIGLGDGIATIGVEAGSSGMVSVTGTGSEWNNVDMTVGASGTGSLSITDGGVVNTSDTGIVGQNAGSSGTVTVTGAGSQWSAGATIIGDNGSGTVSVTDGGIVSGSSAVLGNAAGSTGAVTVTGSGSQLNLTAGLTVGNDGTGTLGVTAGASLTVGGAVNIGMGDGDGVVTVSGGSTVVSGDVNLGAQTSAETGSGTLNVSGAGTTWSMGDLTIGYDGGTGEMNIAGGAQVDTTFLSMGNGLAAEGLLTISGVGSQLTVSGPYGYVDLGLYGPATVVVSNGGVLAIDGSAYTAEDAGATTNVTVTGAGSMWTMTGDLTAGYYGGDSTINVLDGGQVEVGQDLYTAYSGAGDTSTILISGTGSQFLVSGDAYLSYGSDDGDGPSTLSVANGGLFQVDGTTYLGGGDQATVTVTGRGSAWIANDIEIGVYGDDPDFPNARGDVVVSNGGSIEAANISLGTDILYPGNPGIGTLSVTGAGSNVSLTGALTIADSGTGTVTLANGGTISTTGVSIANQAGSVGTLIFGAASGDAPAATGTLSTPTVTFGSGTGEIVFNHTSNLSFASELLGSGVLSVLAGTTTFTTDSASYSGAIDVSGGKVVFNADYSGGDVTVSGSGIVGGSGTIASLDVLSGGTVAPGNSPGTLSVGGNVSFAAGSTYAVEVNGTQHDLIDAGGSATLTGGTVVVSGSPALMTYTILTAASGVTGTFDGLSSASAFYLYSLDYDANNVYLVVDGINSFTIAARTPNQYAVANALDKFPSANPLYSAILAGSVSDAQQAFNALSGEIHASVGSALADDSRYVREAITGRLIQAYYGGVGAGGGQPIVMASAAPTDVVEMDSSSRMSLGAGYASSRDAAPSAGRDLAWWSRAFGAWGEYNTNGNAATTDRNLGGFITGVDGGLGGGWRAGLVTGYMYTGLSVDDRWSSANINSYVLGGYAGGALGGGFALRSGGTWTWNSIDSNRSVIFPGFYEGEAANYDGDVGQLFAEFAYPVFTHGGVVEPFAGLAYVHVGTDGFTESGPVAGLTSGGLDMNLGYGTLGARTGTTMVWGATTVIPHASLAWQYAFGDTTPEQALAFASTGIGMGIGGVPLAQNSALVEVGIDALVAQDATLGISYIGQYSGDFTDTGLRGRFNWKF
ncbi:autotransporter domain-containing protein [Hyphomicrobium sp. NDB2Meth4]|uniref:autotransporter outer membrane beta-barrel domain-containing protein n=1 Tax=Hyphomicrobium sp. NDB2Meth4 TaxID=1892846 RepID=UPI0009302460|nr:autotransporter domain-containing protein [Hyphomicrobium sp. NDB2Meth4]